jgi:hypothetical protein
VREAVDQLAGPAEFVEASMMVSAEQGRVIDRGSSGELEVIDVVGFELARVLRTVIG